MRTAGSGTDSEKQCASLEGRPARPKSSSEIKRNQGSRSSALKETSAPAGDQIEDDALVVEGPEPPAYKDPTKERAMKGIAPDKEDGTRKMNRSKVVHSREVCRPLPTHS